MKIKNTVARTTEVNLGNHNLFDVMKELQTCITNYNLPKNTEVSFTEEYSRYDQSYFITVTFNYAEEETDIEYDLRTRKEAAELEKRKA